MGFTQIVCFILGFATGALQSESMRKIVIIIVVLFDLIILPFILAILASIISVIDINKLAFISPFIAFIIVIVIIICIDVALVHLGFKVGEKCFAKSNNNTTT